MIDPLERAWRHEGAAITASLARRLGDLSLAEDALQDAFAIAVRRWPREGVPERPGAWLSVVAWRRALDFRRDDRLVPSGEGLDTVPSPSDQLDPPLLQVDDDRLALLLLCCHPSLALETRVALTLRHVAGLSATEVAAMLLLPEVTVTKRLVRARRRLKDSGARFDLPDPKALPQRLDAARAVIALIFTEGHLTSGGGAPIRSEMCEEAVWLARQLHEIVPGDDEAAGLLALLMLQHARRDARQDAAGHLIPFPEQDTALWDRDAVAEARIVLARTGRSVGPWQLQAAIALVHTTAGERGTPIPWVHVERLYAALARLDPSPVVRLHHAVAVSRAEGPERALAMLDELAVDGRLEGYVPYHAARADILERDGADARDAWLSAAARTVNAEQRHSLLVRAGGVGESP